MESKLMPLESEFGTLIKDYDKLPKPTPTNININAYNPSSDNFPEIPSFQEDLLNYKDNFEYKGGKNKLICRSESHDYYSPSFSTSCDVDNIDFHDFASDCLSTSKSDNQVYNILYQPQLPEFITEYDHKTNQSDQKPVISLPNFTREANNNSLQVIPTQYLPQNFTQTFPIERIKAEPLMESNLYYPQNFTIEALSNNTCEGILSNVQSLGQSNMPSNQYNVIVDEGVKDYSRAREISSTSESKVVEDGFELVQLPKYKPVEIIEKNVEVPLVHKIDTIVNVDKIQEVEKIVKVPYEKYVDKIVEETEIHYQDEIVEVLEYHDVTKTIKVPQVKERIKYEPKFDVKTIPKYVEVPNVQFIDKYEEYEEVEEVCKYVAEPQVIEVPKEMIKTVIVPVKKIIQQEVIKPVIKTRRVPVEKIKYVDKYETVEVIRNIPQIIDVPVPQHIPKVEYIDQPYEVEKYRDVPVPYPVKKVIKPIYYYTNEVKYVEVPVYKPYLVIHDHVDFKPLNEFENLQMNNNENFSKVVNIRPMNEHDQVKPEN